MKIRLHQILISAGMVIAAGSQLFAQDGTLQDYEVSDPERDRLEREKIIYSPGEGEIRYIPRNPVAQPSVGSATTSRDTISAGQAPTEIAVPKAKPEQTVKPPEKPMVPREDESILSFNFLYYIIQKYKLQDIID